MFNFENLEAEVRGWVVGLLGDKAEKLKIRRVSRGELPCIASGSTDLHGDDMEVRTPEVAVLGDGWRPAPTRRFVSRGGTNISWQEFLGEGISSPTLWRCQREGRYATPAEVGLRQERTGWEEVILFLPSSTAESEEKTFFAQMAFRELVDDGLPKSLVARVMRVTGATLLRITHDYAKKLCWATYTPAGGRQAVDAIDTVLSRGFGRARIERALEALGFPVPNVGTATDQARVLRGALPIVLFYGQEAEERRTGGLIPLPRRSRGSY